MASIYIDSSDNEADFTSGVAKPNQAPYAPPRLTATAKPSPGRFQLPASNSLARTSANSACRSVSVSSSSGRPTPAPQDPSIIHSTPKALKGSTLNSKNNTAEPTVSGLSVSSKLGSDKAVRASLALERQINGLAGTVEDFRSAHDEGLREVRSALAFILGTIKRWEASVSSGQASAGTMGDFGAPLPPPPPPGNLNTGPTPVDGWPLMSNPPVTPELVDIVTKVISEARSRVGKKKHGADENSLKDHARKSFYRMLNISSAQWIRPFFEDAHGEPDTLPAQFMDPDTLYCQPYPHWNKQLIRQVQWIPTYVERFRAMIPNDQSELSNTLRSLSLEHIITLLYDGPFKTACAAWRNTRRTDEEIKQMRSDSRRYQRGERKVAVRSRYIQSIPTLQSPEYGFLCHSGYMSVDESDDEGNLVTKIPSTRSKWVTNAFRAMNVAEFVRSKGKFRPPSKSEIVEAPIPHMERGTGNTKVIVRVAACAISKSWRASHPEDFAKFAHSVNGSETNKPNILEFLERYPLSLLNCNEDEILVKEEERNSKVGTGEDAPVEWAQTTALDYDGDEESGVILEVLELDEHRAAGPGAGIASGVNIPIDPQLQPAHDNVPFVTPPSHYESSPPPVENILGGMFTPVANGSNHPFPDVQMQPPAPPAFEVPPTPAFEMPPPPAFGMPPPPPLPSSVTVEPDQATSIPQAANSASSAKKRRGRPPGSKNKKPKVTA